MSENTQTTVYDEVAEVLDKLRPFLRATAVTWNWLTLKTASLS